MRGLRGHPPPAMREGMFFERCRSVHTFGMRSAISVAFLDRALRVVEVRRCRPGRVIRARAPAGRHAIECDARSELRIGECFRPAARARR
jgi:hypothetical protein